MNLPLIQQPYIYSSLGLLTNLPYMFTAGEASIQYCSQQFFIATQKNFKLFKVKKAYTGVQVIEPASEKTLNFINMINAYVPIAMDVIVHSNYKLTPHLRLMNEQVQVIKQIFPIGINSYQLSDQRYISSLIPTLEGMVIMLKKFSVQSLHIKDFDERKKWKNDQLKTIMSLFRNGYKKKPRANLVRLIINHLPNKLGGFEENKVESNISAQVQQTIKVLVQENDEGIIHLFYQVTRDLAGGYCTQIFVISSLEYDFTTRAITVDKSQIVSLDSMSQQSIYMFMMKTVSLDLHGLEGFNQESIKQWFQQYLSSHQYLYYKSKEISPDMIVVK